MGERPVYPDRSTNTKAEGTNRTEQLEKSQRPPSKDLTLFHSPRHILGLFFRHTSIHDSECPPGYEPCEEKLLSVCWPLPTAGT